MSRPRSERFVLPETERPGPESSGLDVPYWEGLRNERIMIQWCAACEAWQWGPEWICHRCQAFDLGWRELPSADGRYSGRIYSWERIWHPADPRYAEAVPYVVVLVEPDGAPGVRFLGNLVDPPGGPIPIDGEVSAVFEHHDDFTLLQWAMGDHVTDTAIRRR